MKNFISIITIIYFLLLGVNVNSQQGKRIPAKGFAVSEAKGKFHSYEFSRRPLEDDDILFEILYTGICHSDVHKVRDDWKKEKYPIVPGHEIAGRVVKVGKNVTRFKVGDYAGVGVWIGSCGECEFCKSGMEHICEKKIISFAGIDYQHNDEPTNGGYSNNYLVSEKFAIKIPSDAEIEKVAPLLCAGITAFNPLQYSNVKKGDKVGVAGFGGLGHMAVKFAVSKGADVTVFDITEDKRKDAIKMGAIKYVNVRNEGELEGLKNSFDLIVNSIPASHDPLLYMKMLKLYGEMAILGLPPTEETPKIATSSFPMNQLRRVYGSDTGSIGQIQKMVDYAVANNIYPEVEIINAEASEIDKAYQNILDGKVKFRYVINMKTLK